MSKIVIPTEVSEIAATLMSAGFEAYLVGGCVRDIILDREPNDWDVATNAKPEEVMKIFPDSVYENDFGTVLVKVREVDVITPPNLPSERGGTKPSVFMTVEVTTYRIEGKYSDKRHPDEVVFAKTIEEDLSRRDFTVNAMALSATRDKKQETIPGTPSPSSLSRVSGLLSLTDPFGGQEDLKKKIIRTVGKPEDRFAEDALRLMRAVRFAMQLNFTIDSETREAILSHSRELEDIAKERIKDELVKIIETPNAARGILLLEELGLLQYILPEIREGIGVAQNLHHVYTVFEHNIKALDYTAKQNYPLPIRLAALLHDVGKPRSKQGNGLHATFYQHEYIGAKMAVKALDRLRFSRELVDQVAHLVRTHMFYYNTGEVSDAGVRRLVKRMGSDNVGDVLKVREADRIGSGVPKAVPYKLRHLLFMMEKVQRDPLSPKMLAVNGDNLMALLSLPQSMRVGWILNALLEEVLDDPARNTKEYLETRAKELNKLPDEALKKLWAAAQEKKEETEEGIQEDIKRRHHV
jgi:poly(A) polymerase/tRNA nucleotidyltransferase (CCA-adding enzyme)